MHNAMVSQFLTVIETTAGYCSSPGECEVLRMVLDNMAETPSFLGVDDNKLDQVRGAVAAQKLFLESRASA